MLHLYTTLKVEVAEELVEVVEELEEMTAHFF
jgi:hypothetical protein